MAFLLNLFAGNVIFFCSKSETLWKNSSLFERTFPLSKRSLALEESSFNKLSKKPLLKVGNWQNGSWNIRNCDEKQFLGLLTCSSFNEAKIISAMSERFFPQNLKKTREFLFWTTLFSSKCSSGLIDQSFVIPADFVCGKSKLFLLYNRNSFKEHFFVRKIFFSFETILSTQRKPFRQTFHKTSAKKVGNWQSGSSNIRKCDKIWSPGYVIFSLGKAAKSFLGNFPEFFAQIQKTTKVCLFFTKLFLFQNVPFLPNFLPKIQNFFCSNSANH